MLVPKWTRLSLYVYGIPLRITSAPIPSEIPTLLRSLYKSFSLNSETMLLRSLYKSLSLNSGTMLLTNLYKSFSSNSETMLLRSL